MIGWGRPRATWPAKAERRRSGKPSVVVLSTGGGTRGAAAADVGQGSDQQARGAGDKLDGAEGEKGGRGDGGRWDGGTGGRGSRAGRRRGRCGMCCTTDDELALTGSSAQGAEASDEGGQARRLSPGRRGAARCRVEDKGTRRNQTPMAAHSKAARDGGQDGETGVVDGRQGTADSRDVHTWDRPRRMGSSTKGPAGEGRVDRDLPFFPLAAFPVFGQGIGRLGLSGRQGALAPRVCLLYRDGSPRPSRRRRG